MSGLRALRARPSARDSVASNALRALSEPLATHQQINPLVAEQADAPVSETGARTGMSVRLGPRGPITEVR